MLALAQRGLWLAALLLCSFPSLAAAKAERFDYWVLSLSWSPTHCASPLGKRDRIQCAGPRPFSFIVHGLWPQHERGYPQSCPVSDRPHPDLVESLLDLMPSHGLIHHEWRKHGACTSLSPESYFAEVRRARASIKIPPNFDYPRTARRLSLTAIERELSDVNPALQPDRIAVVCQRGYLQEVRICLDRELKPRRCGADVRDRCPTREITIAPVR